MGLGAAQPNISQQVIKRLEILRPPEALIEQYNVAAEAMLQGVRLLQQRNLNLRATRDLLLPKLISGEIDVPNTVEARLEAAV